MSQIVTLSEFQIMGEGHEDNIWFVGSKEGPTYRRTGYGHVLVYPFGIRRVGNHTLKDLEGMTETSLGSIRRENPEIYRAFFPNDA